MPRTRSQHSPEPSVDMASPPSDLATLLQFMEQQRRQEEQQRRQEDDQQRQEEEKRRQQEAATRQQEFAALIAALQPINIPATPAASAQNSPSRTTGTTSV
ncbi:hypothetical protein Pcinc_014609 [Petrolisthes cinctipes]|uniref:Uncharacterized protein n=1 Tax=Petrolisthes cinctipes TaxID=88211 RepID=A0AAE1KQK6_PETCI|nr:hypothetical protein Pcinc_014609 [Petrolisthes cinctipes]